ncbi:coadhesin-like [Lineus longissimus]|uniref:coadhesin-like n=1 Tax=Lineus longissimus TaxID=88925 RepID=UPI002B4E49BF
MMRKSSRSGSVLIAKIVIDDMSPFFAHLCLCTLLLLEIQGSVQGFPSNDSSGSNVVDLAPSNVTETVRWSNWSDCSLSCGGGERTRIKLVPDCNISTSADDEPADNSSVCVDTESCNAHRCPVNGHWEPWKPWSVCSTTCGPTGVRTRHRECKPSLAERYGGNDCAGLNQQIKSCNRKNCPVHGGWTDWSDWSEPTKTCADFVVFKTRTCTNPEPKYGGQPCIGSFRQVEYRIHAVFPNCPVDGGWSRWSSWSTASVTCGKPVVERTRSCTEPQPQYNGKECNGAPRQTKVIDKGVPCPIHGGWSEWATLTESCPPSKRLWEGRSCINPTPKHKGRLCNGTSQRQVTCEPVRVNGGWCEWEAWGQCSKFCYQNNKTEQFRQRIRKCECPKPENGGQVCGNAESETSDCAKNDQQQCNPPTRAPCKKADTSDSENGYDYGGDYGNGEGGEEVTTAGPQYGNYDDYGDC